MKTIVGGVLALTVVATYAVEGQDKNLDLKNELAKLQGTWLIVSAEINGKAVEPATLKEMKVVIYDNRWTRVTPQRAWHGTFSLAPNAPIPAIDKMWTESRIGGTSGFGWPTKRYYMIPGIYEVTGDTLKLCFRYSSETRPAAFSSDGAELVVLKRLTTKKQTTLQKLLDEVGRPKLEPEQVQKLIEKLAGAREDTKKALTQMQGTWIPISAENNGQAAGPEILKDAKVLIKGNHWSLQTPMGVSQGIFSVDPGAKPAAINTMGIQGGVGEKAGLWYGKGAKKVTLQGIYEFDGDTLKLCFRHGKGGRPKGFSTRQGKDDSMLEYIILKWQPGPEK